MQCACLQECVFSNGRNDNFVLHPLSSCALQSQKNAWHCVYFRLCITKVLFEWIIMNNNETHSAFPNVSPIRASVLGHLHRDSFDCHFTPFIGCVRKCPPPRPPAGDTRPPPLAMSPLLGCGLRKRIGQRCSSLSTPTLRTSLHSYPPLHHPPPQRFRPVRRGQGGARSLSLSFHPQALLLNQSVLICPSGRSLNP